MNRRQLIQRGSLASVALMAPSLFLAGCSGDTIKGILNTVLDSAKALLGLLAPNSAFYTDFAAAIAKLEADEAQWTAGGAVTILEEGLTAVQDVLAVIPQTMVFSPLIAILVAGIDAVLNLIPQPAVVAHAARRANPYKGQATLLSPHVFQSHAGAYRAQWNAQAVALGLARAKI
jgi:hypothetical protein